MGRIQLSLPPFVTEVRKNQQQYVRISYTKFVYTLLWYYGTVPAANASGCTAAEGLLYKPWSLVVPTCTARCLHQRL